MGGFVIDEKELVGVQVEQSGGYREWCKWATSRAVDVDLATWNVLESGEKARVNGASVLYAGSGV